MMYEHLVRNSAITDSFFNQGFFASLQYLFDYKGLQTAYMTYHDRGSLRKLKIKFLEVCSITGA